VASAGADLPHAGELDLEDDRRLFVDVRGGLQALHDKAENPAAALLFGAGQPLEEPLVEDRVIVTPDAIPAAPDGHVRRRRSAARMSRWKL